MPAKLEGALNLRKALRNYTPDLNKALNKRMRSALKPIVTEARGFIPDTAPLSNWGNDNQKFPQYQASVMKSGIRTKVSPTKTNQSGFKYLARIEQVTAAGAIWETARKPQRWVGSNAGGTGKGVSRSKNPNAGQQFIDALGAGVQSSQGFGRGIYKAFKSHELETNSAIVDALNDASAKFKESVGFA